MAKRRTQGPIDEFHLALAEEKLSRNRAVWQNFWFMVNRVYLPRIFQTIILAAIVIMLLWLGYQQSWTGLRSVQEKAGYMPAKYLWDWLELLAIPVAIGVVGLQYIKLRKHELELLNKAKIRREEALEETRKVQRDIASDRRHEEVLRVYLDRMGELVIKQRLHESNPDEPVRLMARTLTLSALQSLDGERKGLVLKFLIEGNLVLKSDPLVNLREADLRNVDLSMRNDDRVAGMSGYCRSQYDGINLSHVDLSNAHIGHCDFKDSDFSGTLFFQTELDGTDFTRSSLIGTRFEQAKIGGVTFDEACLSNAKFIHINSGRNSFRNANLEYGWFSDVSISEYHFHGSNLHGVRIDSDCNFDAELREKAKEFHTSWPEKEEHF